MNEGIGCDFGHSRAYLNSNQSRKQATVATDNQTRRNQSKGIPRKPLETKEK